LRLGSADERCVESDIEYFCKKSPLIFARIGQIEVGSKRPLQQNFGLGDQQGLIMILHRLACAAVALAISAAIVPLGRMVAATSQVTEMPNGLKYSETETGSGATATAGHKVSVHYTGWLSENGSKGKKFDSSVDRGQPFQFTLGAHQVIAGWDEGVSGMKVGGKRTLIIPPELGYGARGAGGVIPPNATLIFDVELLGVQ
jgi:peptidylprolyl isomerase